MLKNPAEYAIAISSGKFVAISRQVSPDWLIGVSTGTFQRTMMDESGMLGTQMGTVNRSENGRCARDVLYNTTP
jgi:hypothetical protein